MAQKGLTSSLSFRAADELFQHGGELGERMCAIDWSRTPLGPVATWPNSLKACVRIVLTSRQPMFVWWGDSLINLYNDAYKSILGGKHPRALGEPASTVWREIWDEVGPRAAAAMLGNHGTYDEALLLVMERNGYEEETYYTFSYSPVPNDDGKTGGLICANTDDTRRILGERQLMTLRELGARAIDARDAHEACERAVDALAVNPHDIPFALVYLHTAERKIAAVECATPGIARIDASAWTTEGTNETNELRVVRDLGRFGALPKGAWPKPPKEAALVPIPASGESGRGGVLVVGLNPFRKLDDAYRSFLGLVAGQISASIANAVAYEEERKRATALAEIDRSKTAFFSNISHEFRTPLTLMLGPTEDALASEERALVGADLETVHRNQLRLLKLVNALLDFSRIEAGRVQAAYAPTDLAALTVDLASSFRSAIERAGLAFDVDCPPLPELVYVDHDMWEKSVLNLLSNALKFTFEGRIAVELRWLGAAAQLTVRDSGVGIAEHELPRIFERFHRVEGTRARTHEGSGIGLALVRDLVRLQGGTIEVASKVDAGTTFTITIPAGSSHLPKDRIAPANRAPASRSTGAAYVEEALRWTPAAPNDAPASRPDLATTRILVADDNADMRDYITRILGRHWSVEAVSDGAAALEAARSRRPDLVLSDVMMPLVDGFQLVRELRSDPRTATTPIILLSARAGEEAAAEGLRAGADDYLVKPFSAGALVVRVEAQLAAVRMRDAHAEERERATRLLEDAVRAREDLLAIVSHDLRNPLSTVLMGATQIERLADDSATGVRSKKAAAAIIRAVNQMTRLVGDLLDLAKLEANQQVAIELAPHDFGKLACEAVEQLEPLARTRRITLTTSVPSPLIAVCDSDRIQQVLANLIGNAIKFTLDGGSIALRAEAADREIIVSVEDTGIGIPEEQIAHIFTAYWQADARQKTSAGAGLGLSIVKAIVEAHGGRVWVESVLGRGSTFYFTLEQRRADG